jgi:hypothetical protein
MNQTAGGFGIDIVGDGSDDSDAFDGGVASESMSFSFDVAGLFNSIEFDRFTGAGAPGDDAGFLSFSGGPTINFDNTDLSSNVLTVDVAFTPGQTITLGFADGNGFGLENFDISPVPEPSSMALIGSGALMICYFRRRQTRV